LFFVERGIDCREGLLYIWEDESFWLWVWAMGGGEGKVDLETNEFLKCIIRRRIHI
jgi:hypothetical protein